MDVNPCNHFVEQAMAVTEEDMELHLCFVAAMLYSPMGFPWGINACFSEMDAERKFILKLWDSTYTF